MLFRGVRGAITIEENKEEVIIQATDRLLRKMIEDNDINPELVASVFISVTDDITDVFPARAMRSIEGWNHVPVMCMKEISVKSGLEKCIRVMMHINTDKSQQEIKHIYLERAVMLRPDIVNKK